MFRSLKPVQNDDVIAVIHNIPQRSLTGLPLTPNRHSRILILTDCLVQNYLYTLNYRYYPIYPPTFLDEYSQWWNDRINRHQLSPEFTCLLLRVCACSSQALTSTTQQHLEFELAESVQSLSERLHRAAEKLSSSFSPGQGGLAQVQQLFLTATWYKSEGLIVESWHALGASIKVAQELCK